MSGSGFGAPARRVVLVHFAAGATDLAAATAQAARDGGIVINLATGNAATVALPGPLRSVTQAIAVPPTGGGGPVSTLVDVSPSPVGPPWEYQVDPGSYVAAAGETGAVTVSYTPFPAATAGWVVAILAC